MCYFYFDQNTILKQYLDFFTLTSLCIYTLYNQLPSRLIITSDIHLSFMIIKISEFFYAD